MAASITFRDVEVSGPKHGVSDEDLKAGTSKDPSNQKGLGYVLITLLTVSALVCVVAIVSTIQEWVLLSRARQGGVISIAQATTNDYRQHVISLAALIVFMAAVLAWLIWQFRAQRSLRQRFPSVRFTPGWAVGWWFVPFANFGMPFKTVKELWLGRAETELTSRQKRAPIVRVWWILYLLGGVLSWASLSASKAANAALPDSNAFFHQVFAHESLFVVARVAEIGAAVMAIRIVMRVQARSGSQAMLVLAEPLGHEKTVEHGALECQHCGQSADAVRTYCPSCKRRMRPMQPSVATPIATPSVAPADSDGSDPSRWFSRPWGFLAPLGIAALIVGASAALTGSSERPSEPPVYASASPTPSIEGPRHNTSQPLAQLLAAPPLGWTFTSKDVVLSATQLSKGFKIPEAIARDLALDGFKRGIARGYYLEKPREVIAVELWQFATPDGAAAFFQEYSNGNQPGRNSIYSSSIPSSDGSTIYLGARNDKYGFSFGVGLQRLGDIIVHVRYSALDKVSKAEVSTVLERASKTVLDRGTTI